MIYLAFTEATVAQVLAAAACDDALQLADRFLVADTRLTRSQLYHRLKALQASDAPLLVAELSEPPKLKGMPPGSAAWLRIRFDPT